MDRARSHAPCRISCFKGPEARAYPGDLQPGGVHMTVSQSTQRPRPELRPAQYAVGTKPEFPVKSMTSREDPLPLPGVSIVTSDSSAGKDQPEAGPPFPFGRSQPSQLILPLAWPSPDQRWQQGFAPKLPPKPVPLARCSEKGCVFPAAGPQGRCLQHQRQWSEPGFYSSHQPTSALLEQGRFGPVRPEWLEDAKAGHAQDRRRMAAEREHFLREQQ